MRPLIEAVLAQLKTVDGVKYVRNWNDQLNLDEKQEGYSFPMPAIFPEFLNPSDIKQLGDGCQLYDPLIVRLHILHWELDAADGNMEQNLNVLDFAQAVYAKMQRFEPDGAVVFVRISEERDYNHKGVYHFVQDYKTNYIDLSKQISTDGTTIAGGVVSPDVVATYDPIKPFIKGT